VIEQDRNVGNTNVIFLLFSLRSCSTLLYDVEPVKDNEIERVFNGYKKKYVDKLLLEFITR
jgi:hypothetical protein